MDTKINHPRGVADRIRYLITRRDDLRQRDLEAARDVLDEVADLFEKWGIPRAPDQDAVSARINDLLTANNRYLARARDAEADAYTLDKAFGEICEELGCEKDNEAALIAAHKIKAGLEAARKEIIDLRTMLLKAADALELERDVFKKAREMLFGGSVTSPSPADAACEGCGGTGLQADGETPCPCTNIGVGYALRRVREIALQSEAAPLSMMEIVKVADMALGEKTALPEWMTGEGLELIGAPALTAGQLADALDAFWNASLMAVHNSVGSDGASSAGTIGAISEGFAAVANRLRVLGGQSNE